LTAVALAALSAVPAVAQDAWPSRPIRMMVGFGAGGGTDIAARVLAEPLGELLGQRVVVENKPGAGGTIAGGEVAKSPKDGYTALMISSGHTVSAVMIKTPPYDAIKDFVPVGVVAHTAFSVITYKDFPANDFRGLIEIAKKEPGKLNYGSVGVGSTQHLTAELLRLRAGIQAQGVPFRTTPEMLTALLRKDIAYAVDPAHTVRGQVASGELKYLAVANGKRWPPLPNVPTVIESGVPNFDVLGWYGLVFPAGVPQAVVDKTAKALAEVLGRENVKKQLENVGALAVASTPAEFGKLIADEVVRWREVATTAGLQAQ
jgi:tripartite-type tricarboxylate transporter receptor subunit TctC